MLVLASTHSACHTWGRWLVFAPPAPSCHVCPRSKEQRSRAKACLALVNQLLQPKVETKGSFMSLTRVAHRFPFPLGFMPITTRQKVAAGVPNSSPLLRLLRDRSARRGTARLTIKPADKHVRRVLLAAWEVEATVDPGLAVHGLLLSCVLCRLRLLRVSGDGGPV